VRLRGIFVRDADRIANVSITVGFANRENLCPREQLNRFRRFLKTRTGKIAGKIRVEFVVPDYYAKYQALHGGWEQLMLITPWGCASLPCRQVVPASP